MGSITIVSEPVPMIQDEEDGTTVRVAGSRVTLENVISTYLQGATAEEIVEEFPTLDLGNVYAVIAYYLHHQSEVESYMAAQEIKGEQLRQKIEAKYSTSEFRDRILALRQQKRRQNQDA